MHLNNLGKIAESEWHQTGHKRPNLELDAFVVMPNHVHAIIVITDPVGTGRALSENAAEPKHT
jgi:putative transposase